MTEQGHTQVTAEDRARVDWQQARIDQTISSDGLLLKPVANTYGVTYCTHYLDGDTTELTASRLEALASTIEQSVSARHVICTVNPHTLQLEVYVYTGDGRRPTLPSPIDGAPMVARVGIDNAGNELAAALTLTQSRALLVCASDGFGAPDVLRSAIFSLAGAADPGQLKMVVADPLQRLQVGTGLPHLMYRPTSSAPAIGSVLTEIAEHIDTRVCSSDLVERFAVDAMVEGSPRIVVVLNEIDWILTACGAAMLRLVHVLLRDGPAVGVHAILAGPRVSNQPLLRLCQQYIGWRICGTVESEQIATEALGFGGSLAPLLRQPGTFVSSIASAPATLFTAYTVPQPVEWALTAQVRQEYDVQSSTASAPHVVARWKNTAKRIAARREPNAPTRLYTGTVPQDLLEYGQSWFRMTGELPTANRLRSWYRTRHNKWLRWEQATRIADELRESLGYPPYYKTFVFVKDTSPDGEE